MAGPRPRKSHAINAALTVAALSLLSWTIYDNRTKLADVIARRPDARLFALGLALYVTALLVTFARWNLLVRALGLPFRLRDAVRLGFIGNVFNLVIPGAVGGDVVKAAFLCREQERKTQAVSSMVIDRLLGLLGLFVLAGVVGLSAWPGGTDRVRRLIAVSWVLAAAGVVGLAILFSPSLYRPLLARLRPDGRAGRLFGELVAMTTAYRSKIGVVAVALAMASVGHALYVCAFYLADVGLFGTRAPSLLSHFVVVPLVLLSTAVPLPFGALGVSENVSGELFRDVVGFEGGAVAMLGYRAIMYAAGLVSVVVYLLNLRQVRELSSTEAVT